VYKGRIEEAGGRVRKFRLLLYAASPDRLHGEVLSPLGRTHLVLDAGEGRLAITFARDGESFVGRAKPEILARILGVPLELETLVGAVLTGAQGPSSVRVARAGGELPGLPQTLELTGDGATLFLELRRLRPLATDPDMLGTGRPPEGTRVRPIEELEGEGERLEALGDDGGGS
jgi:hypothetical protein